MVRILMWCGLFGILASGLILFGGLTSGFSNEQTADLAFNICFAILFFACSRVLARGRAWVIWLFTGTILFSFVYSLAMERGFNFLILLVGALLFWRLWTLKQNGDIS
jgi:hypothetical protein